MIKWQTYANEVAKLVGCKVTHEGRTALAGVDCVGVPYAAAVAAGLQLDAIPSYSAQPTQAELCSGLSLFCDETDDPHTAHIWQVPFIGGARHVVVPLQDVANGTLCVHAWSKRNKVVESLFKSNAVHGWHIKGVEWRQQA